MRGATKPPARQDSRPARLATPQARTKALALAMALAACALGAYSLRWGRPLGPVSLTWWELVPAVALADELGFHLEVRGEAHTFTLSELPLVLGCLFAPAWAVIVARLVGDAAYQLLRRKQRGVKLGFNLSLFSLETVEVLVVFHALVGSRSPVDWVSWPLIFATVAGADLLSMVAVTLAIRWHGGRPRLVPVLLAGVATAVVNVNLALLAAVLLWNVAYAIVLLLTVLVMTSFAYRGYANLSRRYASLKLLYDFTKAVGAKMSAEAVLGHVLGKARELLWAEVAEVVLFDRDSGRPALCQRSTESSPHGAVTAVGPEVTALNWSQLVSSGHARFVSRRDRSPESLALRDQLGVRDFIVAPLRADEAVVGAILVANRLGDVSTFDSADCRLFETLANHASIAFENSQLVHRLREEAEQRRREALHDALTGLPNRALFSQQVDEALTKGRAAIMLMDLDRFKEINDTLGHHNGDLVLCKVASRLVACVGNEGLACRFGGDEFALLVPDIAETRVAERLGARILDALDQPMVVDELSLNVGASIGIAIAPDHGADAATLLQRADVAMYQAKGSRSGTAVYSSEQDTHSMRRLALSGELRGAIEAGEILVYFQPQARVSDGQVVSAEALVRWRHPEHGLIGPDEFVPAAEQTGLIHQLTNHVLHVALRQCAEWGRTGCGLGVAVNLAIRSLLDVNLPQEVDEMLHHYGVPADRLTLEITESSVMGDPGRTITVLERLALCGIRLSVDDFGTGYSSLSYLQRLPVHEVKVDKSFVFGMSSDAGDAIIVQSIIELGHNLGLSVVAEGVEDQISWDRLRLMSCDVAQGYHLSKPVPALVVTQWLAERGHGATARAYAGATAATMAPLKCDAENALWSPAKQVARL